MTQERRLQETKDIVKNGCDTPCTTRQSLNLHSPNWAPDGSGVPYELWRGLTLTAFAEAIGTTELPPRSPALNALWRRLITSKVTAPAGSEGADQFTALRAEALRLSEKSASALRLCCSCGSCGFSLPM